MIPITPSLLFIKWLYSFRRSLFFSSLDSNFVPKILGLKFQWCLSTKKKKKTYNLCIIHKHTNKNIHLILFKKKKIAYHIYFSIFFLISSCLLFASPIFQTSYVSITINAFIFCNNIYSFFWNYFGIFQVQEKLFRLNNISTENSWSYFKCYL